MDESGVNRLYDAAGSSNTHTIILLHGVAFTRKMWLPQVEALADQYRVITPDLPGHGALKSNSFRLDDAVKEIAAIVNRETKHPVLLVGLSVGGYVAIKFAHELPERVVGLVLSGATINYHGFIGFVSKIDATLSLKLYGERRMQQMQEKTLRQMFPTPIAESQIQAGFNFKAIPQAYAELSRYDFRELLRTFRGPALILNGAKDKLNRRGEDALLKATERGKLQIIDNAGHGCNLEQPAAFTTAIRTFANEIEW